MMEGGSFGSDETRFDDNTIRTRVFLGLVPILVYDVWEHFWGRGPVDKMKRNTLEGLLRCDPPRLNRLKQVWTPIQVWSKSLEHDSNHPYKWTLPSNDVYKWSIPHFMHFIQSNRKPTKQIRSLSSLRPGSGKYQPTPLDWGKEFPTCRSSISPARPLSIPRR